MNEQICCKCHETLVNGLSDSLDHVGWWIDCGSEVTRVDPNIVPWPCGTRMKTSLDQASTNVSWSDGPKLLYISHDHVSAQNSAIRDPSRVLLWQLWWTPNPPTFDLHLNGGKWSTASRSGPIYHEIVYSLQKSAILTVCLVQTRDGEVPFISTLEFMPLPDVLYPHLDPNIVISHSLF